MVDSLVLESTRTEEGYVNTLTQCFDILKCLQRYWCLLRISAEEWYAFVLDISAERPYSSPDVLGTLVRLSETDRPFGIQAEVLRAVQNMVVLLDEQFLVHSAVHKAVLRLLRSCVGDDLQEQLDGRTKKVMGAADATVRTQPSEYEEDCASLQTSH